TARDAEHLVNARVIVNIIVNAVAPRIAPPIALEQFLEQGRRIEGLIEACVPVSCSRVMMSAMASPTPGISRKTLFVDDLGERHGKGAQALGGARIGSGAIGITATQGDPLPEFAQQLDNLRVSIAAMA